jgi:hypothetical protein
MKIAMPFLALTAAMFGCASVSATHVPPGDTSPGIHFSRPRPYLLISKQTKAASEKKTTETTKADPVSDSSLVEKTPKAIEKNRLQQGRDICGEGHHRKDANDGRVYEPDRLPP